MKGLNLSNNSENNKWIRPWNKEKFDDLYNRDDRFFSILIKGVLSWLNKNILMYNKPIKHFIFNTGSSYLYVESNGYEFTWNETSGEDYIYMEMPRCIVKIGNVEIPTEELSNPYARGNYERLNGNNIEGFNAEIRRLPVNMKIDLTYILSNFNESIILLEELINKIIFQQYFNIIYLGQIIKCSIEFPNSSEIEINKIDMTSPDINQKTINISVNICSNYPLINERTEIESNKIISSFVFEKEIYETDPNMPDATFSDKEETIKNNG